MNKGRFKSQALLDERALLSCMAYVDLNPIRAVIASTPEQSDYTSVQARIQLKEPIRLALFRDQVPALERDEAVPFYYADYLSLVDWTGRAQRDDKRGSIAVDLPPILDRLGFDQGTWFKTMKLNQQPFAMIGPPDQIREGPSGSHATGSKALARWRFSRKIEVASRVHRAL